MIKTNDTLEFKIENMQDNILYDFTNVGEDLSKIYELLLQPENDGVKYFAICTNDKTQFYLLSPYNRLFPEHSQIRYN